MRSLNQAWTNNELMYHMVLALKLLPTDVRMIKKSRKSPPIPAAFFNWLNVRLTRRGARDLDRVATGESYDHAHERVLSPIDTLQDDEWSLGAEYPGWDPNLSGIVTIKRLLHYPSVHFAEHASQIRRLDG